LDALFTFNIALSIIVLLTALYTVRPLDFMVFPTVLLVTTILRLALNVASTRVVLSDGHTGPGAAGKVIESFGNFLIGGDYLVGAIVFIILTIINFVVITKGAGRIAEVGARFALDAMPGKQMAIDADLNAGMIGEAEARKRRTEVGQEAEFYGAMDGASKYVRGDAVAGIIITVINIIGGIGIGMLQHDLTFSKSIDTYLLLAIGDGLIRMQAPGDPGEGVAPYVTGALFHENARGIIHSGFFFAGAEAESFEIGAVFALKLRSDLGEKRHAFFRRDIA
jgi:flagellar biosynthesis protein FlhA